MVTEYEKIDYYVIMITDQIVSMYKKNFFTFK